MVSTTCRVKIVKGDQQIEIEGTESFVLRMLERYSITSFTTFNQGSLTLREEETNYVSKQITPFEFIRNLNLQKRTDVILGFAYYLEKHSGKQEFSLADIKNLYYESRLETTNISLAISQCTKRGFISQIKPRSSKAKILYRLTRKGEDYFQKISGTINSGN